MKHHTLRTATEEPPWNVQLENCLGFKPVLLARSIILNFDAAQYYKYMLGRRWGPLPHLWLTHKTLWYNKAKGSEPEHKKTINMTTISSTTITKTCLCNFDPLKPHLYIVKLGFTGVYIIFLISAQNIDCGYSLEPPRWGGSNEYHNLYFEQKP